MARFSDAEESYRRGYSQGFWAARQHPDLTYEEVSEWRHGSEPTAPPGSGMEGFVFKELILQENNI